MLRIQAVLFKKKSFYIFSFNLYTIEWITDEEHNMNYNSLLTISIPHSMFSAPWSSRSSRNPVANN